MDFYHEATVDSARGGLDWFIVDRLIKSAYFIPIQEIISVEKCNDPKITG